jgi:hypothetical protein
VAESQGESSFVNLRPLMEIRVLPFGLWRIGIGFVL